MGPMQLCRARRYCHCTICTFDCLTLHTLVSTSCMSQYLSYVTNFDIYNCVPLLALSQNTENTQCSSLPSPFLHDGGQVQNHIWEWGWQHWRYEQESSDSPGQGTRYIHYMSGTGQIIMLHHVWKILMHLACGTLSIPTEVTEVNWPRWGTLSECRQSSQNGPQ